MLFDDFLHPVTRRRLTAPAAGTIVCVRRGDVTHHRANERSPSSLRTGGVVGLLLAHGPEDLCRTSSPPTPLALGLAFFFSFVRIRFGICAAPLPAHLVLVPHSLRTFARLGQRHRVPASPGCGHVRDLSHSHALARRSSSGAAKRHAPALACRLARSSPCAPRDRSRRHRDSGPARRSAASRRSVALRSRALRASPIAKGTIEKMSIP